MAKTTIKAGQQWLHVPSQGIYTVLNRGTIKIPHVGWFKAVTYTDGKKTFTRFLEDFENKFEYVGKKKN